VQSFYPEAFERDMGCTELEWLGWLPDALGDNAWERKASCVQAVIGSGNLQIDWQTASPRVLGLFRIPRLLVRFGFVGLTEAERFVFMKRFDLYMQRGGG
jgi:hypothetical protein